MAHTVPTYTVAEAINVLGLGSLPEDVRRRYTAGAPFSICREVRGGVAGFSVHDMRTGRQVRVATKRDATMVAKAIEASYYGGQR